jgi:hypothetical protein
MSDSGFPLVPSIVPGQFLVSTAGIQGKGPEFPVSRVVCLAHLRINRQPN